MIRNSEGVRRHESDAPLFGVSLSMQFKLANCACARGGVKLLNPTRRRVYVHPTLNSRFEAARHMPEKLLGTCLSSRCLTR